MKKTVRVSSEPAGRGGYALVLFVLASFVLFAFAAMVIDLGLARHTQAQMNSAVETAALDGLRFRDTLSTDRRRAARDIAAWVFDDDLDPDNGDDLNLGAGPLINFSDGIALPGEDFRASEIMSIPAARVYDPDLEINGSNEIGGDMVAGTYRPEEPHEEQNDYSRDDFGPNFDPTTGVDAFLVRLRRSNEAIDPSLGVGSNAPAIPFLFGRGTVAFPDVKANGIPVRSTAIAAAGILPDGNSVGRVMSVGPADMGNGLQGATPFAIEQSAWESADASPTLVKPIVVGKCWTLGEAVTDLGNFSQMDDGGVYRYAPIYVVVDEGSTDERNLIIGFGAIETWDAVDSTTVTLSKQISPLGVNFDFIANENASATPIATEADPHPLSTSDFGVIWSHHTSLEDSLFVPVLMRSAGRVQIEIP